MKIVVFKTFMMAFVCINLASCSSKTPKTPKELKEAAEKLKDSAKYKELSSGQIDDALDLLEEIVEQQIKKNEDLKELAKNLEEGKEQFEKGLEAANENIKNIKNIVNGEDLEYLREAHHLATNVINRSDSNMSEYQKKRFDELYHEWREEYSRFHDLCNFIDLMENR